jgi:hypothetical protein
MRLCTMNRDLVLGVISRCHARLVRELSSPFYASDWVNSSIISALCDYAMSLFPFMQRMPGQDAAHSAQ